MDEQDNSGNNERWATNVFEACRGRCSNCGSDDRLRVEMIVPEAAGGRKLVSNGTLLCRTCTLAREIGERRPYPASGEHTRPINFFVSRGLHNKLGNGLATDNGFRSVSSLVRFLMTRFVGDPDRFDDLEMFQDPGSDVKINVWRGRADDKWVWDGKGDDGTLLPDEHAPTAQRAKKLPMVQRRA